MTEVTPDKPFSPACERNREPILAALRPLLADARQVLEVGSGTGQHAVHFAAAMRWLTWQCSDRAAMLPGIRRWLAETGLANTPPPLVLDVDAPGRPGRFDAVFTANTLHILGWPQVERLFAWLPEVLVPGGRVVVYGPFHQDGRPTSPGNAAFDQQLRLADPASGIRDFAAVDRLARSVGLVPHADQPMPANNRLCAWRQPVS
ncbi:MAG: DUF938 domain-containing protein [Rhodocyclaceae bacterium]|nr:DUF938 domain-containing protein [Rhodocyclaceae bacterium]